MINESNKKLFLFLGLVVMFILALKITGRPIDIRTFIGVPVGTALLMFGWHVIVSGSRKKS